MKVLFLDVDGVLNNEDAFIRRRKELGPAPVCPICCGRLLDLVRAVDCKIVLSSAWRGIPHLEEKLRAAGVLEFSHDDPRTVVLETQILPSGVLIGADTLRGREIAEWLSRHPEVTRYAIVDDDSDMLPEQLPFFVHTTFKTGLLDEHVAGLRAILEAP